MAPTEMFMKENWLTNKPRYGGFGLVFLLTLIVAGLSFYSWNTTEALKNVFTANPEKVFQQHHFFLLWSSLFVHADAAHVLSNMILFVPLLYLLCRYYGGWLWSSLAIGVGGIINLVVLNTLPSVTYLLGISGVVNFLGAAWLCLFFLIDLRESARRRFAVGLFITIMLFIPDTYKPEVSYLSHILGYFFGMVAGFTYYQINRVQIKSEELYEPFEVEILTPHIEPSNL